MIQTKDFMTPCNCRSVGECNHNMMVGLTALNAMVDAFGKEMKDKLREKYLEGREGWDMPEACPTAFLQRALREHCARGDMVDVANFAAMIWNRQQP